MKIRYIYKILSLCMALVLSLLSITACADQSAVSKTSEAETSEAETTSADEEAEASDLTEVNMEKKTYPYIKAYDDNKEETVNLYFTEDGDIPYAALSEYMSFYSDVMKDMSLGDVSFDVQLISDNFYIVTREDNEASIMIDTNEDMIILSDFNSFTQPENVNALVSIIDLPDPEIPDITDILIKIQEAKTEEERNDLLAELQNMVADKPDTLFKSSANSINRTGTSKTLRLSEYMIEIVESEGECYIPLQTLNDFFMGPFYLQFIFNGEKLYALQYGSDVPDEIYSSEPKEMSLEFAMFNFNELCLLMDCFYGLKEEHNISDFAAQFVADQSIYEGLTGTDPKKFDSSLRRFISLYMDDGHSIFSAPSWMAGPQSDLDMLAFSDYDGLSLSNSMTRHDQFSTVRDLAYPDGVPMYEEIGDTAFITFDSFRCKEDDELAQYYDPENAPDPEEFILKQEEDDDNIVDTIWLIIYANQMIRREGSPVKNVVVDLSMNGGGQSTAALFVISWLTGKARVALRDTFTSAETIMTIAADVDLDNTYNSDADSLAGKYNVYVLTSANSFSCGNLVPAACKMATGVTLVGQTSGGGSCSVLACTTASGATFQMSSSMQLSIAKNGSFYNIDQGITPDIVLTKVESFYDRAGLAEYLKECK